METMRHDIYDRSFAFACSIVRLHKQLVERDRKWASLATQLLESGTGVGANLEEADAGHSKADFIAKCVIARKEAFESRFWLRLFLACEIAPASVLQPLIRESQELASILTTIVKNARLTPHRG